MNKTTLRLIREAKDTLEYINELRNPTVMLTDAEHEAMKIIRMAIKYDLDTIDEEEPIPTYIKELGGKKKMHEMSVKILQELELNEVDKKCYIDIVTSIYEGAN